MVTRVLPEATADKTREFHFEVVIHPDHPRLRGLPPAARPLPPLPRGVLPRRAGRPRRRTRRG